MKVEDEFDVKRSKSHDVAEYAQYERLATNIASLPQISEKFEQTFKSMESLVASHSSAKDEMIKSLTAQLKHEQHEKDVDYEALRRSCRRCALEGRSNATDDSGQHHDEASRAVGKWQLAQRASIARF